MGCPPHEGQIDQSPTDFDGNEQTNLHDFADCYTGSTGADRTHGGPYVSLRRESARAEARGSGLYADPCCGIMDFDTDGDIDLTDFAALSEAFNEAPE